MKAKLVYLCQRVLPLLLVIAVGLFIGLRNIDPTTTYTGWDNIHAEFDLPRYARQVFFGAWIEHQSLGAPAAQGHLSEVARLPILFLLTSILPAQLVRYVFIFSMYLIGGIGMYLFLAKTWISEQSGGFKNWLASLGAVFYLLHVLTLQQFYISFEMFTIQFAFLPFLLLTIHRLVEKVTVKNLLIFCGVQILIAPSAHTPTIFYLAVLFSVAYAFFLSLAKQSFWQSIKVSFLIGLLTFFANAHWILPNLYYSIHDSRYVQESRDNQLFAPESVWSIREAGTLENLTSGMHYLFKWQDYSFETGKYDLIFNEWQSHLSQPYVLWMLRILGSITLLGVLATVLAARKKPQNWAVLGMYVFCLLFIFIDLFPTNVLFDKLYEIGSFREAFRNPFTKLSVLYSFVSILLFVQIIDSVVSWLKTKKLRVVGSLIILCLLAVVGCTAWPSFGGHFISEKLKVVYPSEYRQMFEYLKTRDENLRILQLPQQSHAGWEIYDWQFIRKSNGYQGMGFYFFGFPQAFLNRDSDRWVETSDFFYAELKHALDTRDVTQVKEITQKYNVDLVIIDETKFDPNRDRDYDADKTLITEAGFTKVWQLNFLTIYDRQAPQAENEVITPEKISFVAADTRRVRTDFVYRNEGDYIPVGNEQASVLYPFMSLMAHEVTQGAETTTNGAEMTVTVPNQQYAVTLPALKSSTYFVPAAVRYEGKKVTVTFPALQLTTAAEKRFLPRLADFDFTVETADPSVLVIFNSVGVIATQGETIYPIIQLKNNATLFVDYAQNVSRAPLLESGEVDGSQLVVTQVKKITPNWSELEQPLSFVTSQPINELSFGSTFPTVSIDLLKNPSVNCVPTKPGSIETKKTAEGIVYSADRYAVNCNGYSFGDVSAAYSYLLRIQGKNYQGRGTKLFVNYADPKVVPEDYLIQAKNFDSFITLDKVTDDSRLGFYLNWETRSFGKQSVNELSSMQISPFPLDQFAQLKLTTTAVQPAVKNDVTVSNTQKYLDSVHLIEYDCRSEKCYVGIDQTYDDLWLGIDQKSFSLLPHFRLNNWANIWQVSGQNRLIVLYLPELISLAAMTTFVGGLLVLLLKLRNRKQVVS